MIDYCLNKNDCKQANKRKQMQACMCGNDNLQSHVDVGENFCSDFRNQVAASLNYPVQ